LQSPHGDSRAFCRFYQDEAVAVATDITCAHNGEHMNDKELDERFARLEGLITKLVERMTLGFARVD
jgi:hypothetical protein